MPWILTTYGGRLLICVAVARWNSLPVIPLCHHTFCSESPQDIFILIKLAFVARNKSLGNATVYYR